MSKIDFSSEVFEDVPIDLNSYRRIKSHRDQVNYLIEFYENFYTIRVRGNVNKSRVIEAYSRYCDLNHNIRWLFPSEVRCADFIAWLTKQ